MLGGHFSSGSTLKGVSVPTNASSTIITKSQQEGPEQRATRAPTLLKLPYEILVEIISSLPPPAIMTVCRLSRQLKAICKDDFLWKRAAEKMMTERLAWAPPKGYPQGSLSTHPFASMIRPSMTSWKWLALCKGHTITAKAAVSSRFTGLASCQNVVTKLGVGYYEGEWENGHPHGRGVLYKVGGGGSSMASVWKCSTFFCGDWNAGNIGASGTYQWNEKERYEGEWSWQAAALCQQLLPWATAATMPKQHGRGMAWYAADGSQYTGGFNDGKHHGWGRRTWPDGSSYEGEFHDGVKFGQGTYRYKDGSVYEGNWSNGKFHGVGAYFWLDGSRYTGQWRFDRKHGQGEYCWADGSKYVGTWEKGKRHGLGKMTWGDGSYFDGVWCEDVPCRGINVGSDGKAQPDGNPLEMRYTNFFTLGRDEWEKCYEDIHRERLRLARALRRVQTQGFVVRYFAPNGMQLIR